VSVRALSRAWLRWGSLALVAGCVTVEESPRAHPKPGAASLVLGVRVQTSARQRVQLRIDDGARSTPPISATADLPASATSRDFVVRLAFVLGEKGCPATSGESCDPRHDPEASEALRLPPHFRVVGLVIEKLAGDEWLPSGPADLLSLPTR
jgi:hypothetical protein